MTLKNNGIRRVSLLFCFCFPPMVYNCPPPFKIYGSPRGTTSAALPETAIRRCGSFNNQTAGIAFWPMTSEDGADGLQDTLRGLTLEVSGTNSRFYNDPGPFGLPSTSLTMSAGVSRISTETRLNSPTTDYWIGVFVLTTRNPSGIPLWPVIYIFDNNETINGMKLAISIDRSSSTDAASVYLTCAGRQCHGPVSVIPYDKWSFISVGVTADNITVTTSNADSNYAVFKTTEFIGNDMAGLSSWAKLMLGRGVVGVTPNILTPPNATVADGMRDGDAMSCLGIFSTSQIDVASYISYCSCWLSKTKSYTTSKLHDTTAAITQAPVTVDPLNCAYPEPANAVAIWPMTSNLGTVDVVKQILLQTNAYTTSVGPFGIPATAWTANFLINILANPTNLDATASSYWLSFFIRTSHDAGFFTPWPVLHVFDSFGIKVSFYCDRSASANQAQLLLTLAGGMNIVRIAAFPYDQWVHFAFGYSSSDKTITTAISYDSEFKSYLKSSFATATALGWTSKPFITIGQGNYYGTILTGTVSTDLMSCLGFYNKAWIEPATFASFCSCAPSLAPVASPTLNETIYFWSATKQGWISSDSACKRQGGVLANIRTRSEMDRLKALFYLVSGWLGLTKKGDIWSWADGTPIDSALWGFGEPSGDGLCGEVWIGKEGYAYAYNDERCNSFAPALCQKQAPIIDIGYFLTGVQVLWPDAAAACQTLGGRLALPRSVEDLSILYNRFGHVHFYIGLTSTDFKWSTTDGSVLDSSLWCRGQPERSAANSCARTIASDSAPFLCFTETTCDSRLLTLCRKI